MVRFIIHSLNLITIYLWHSSILKSYLGSPSVLRDYISVGYMLLILHEGIEERNTFLLFLHSKIFSQWILICIPGYIFYLFFLLHLHLPAIIRFLCSRRVFQVSICVFHPCICVDTFVVFPSPAWAHRRAGLSTPAPALNTAHCTLHTTLYTIAHCTPHYTP